MRAGAGMAVKCSEVSELRGVMMEGRGGKRKEAERATGIEEGGRGERD